MKTHQAHIVKHSQAIIFQEMLTHDRKHLRATIKSDAYRDQCSATVEVLSPDNTWHVLTYMHPQLMQTKEKLIYRPEFHSSPPVMDKVKFYHYFEDDREELIAEAMRLLSTPKE